MKNFDNDLLHFEVFNYLKTQKLMSLSTFGDKPWISIVFFTVDNDLNIYFLSDPNTIHCKSFEQNSDVCCAMYDSNQTLTDKKIGVQILGKVEKVPFSRERLKTVVMMWNKHNPGLENLINIKNIATKKIHSQFYKVVPENIKFFNEELFGEDESKEFSL